MTKLLQVMLLTAFVLGTELVDGADNCGWESEERLEDDDQSVPIQVSNNNAYGYRNNVSCETRVIYSGYRSRHLRVKVESFDLEGSSATGSACLVESERLTIQLTTPEGHKDVTWCGQLYAENHIFSTSSLTIKYNTGQIGRGTGFRLRVQPVLVNSHYAGDLHAGDSPRLLYSPGYPKNYDSHMDYSVKLVGQKGHFIHVRILMKDLESAHTSSSCFDFLSIEGDIHCGSSYDTRDIVIHKDEASIRFHSDSNLQQRGYVLEYASYPVESSSAGRDGTDLVRVDQARKLIHVQTASKMRFVPTDDDEALHIYFIGLENNQFFLGTLSEVGYNSRETRIPRALKHYWGRKGKEIILSLTSEIFLLVQSGAGYSVGLFPAEQTAAWLQRDYDWEDKRGVKVYVPEGSSYNIAVDSSEAWDSSLITVNNGPSTDYFDLVKGCVPGAVDRDDVLISNHTDVVTIDLHPDLWRTGVWIQYYKTRSQFVHDVHGNASFNLLDSSHGRKLMNFFCSLRVLPSTFPGSLEVRTNLESPDAEIILKGKGPYDGLVEVARLGESGVQEVNLRFPSDYQVRIDVFLSDSSKISTQDPYILIEALDTTTESLACHNPPIFASSYHPEEVAAPPFLILGTQDSCSWKVTAVPEPGHQVSNLVKLTVFGATSLQPRNSELCAVLELEQEYVRGGQQVMLVCAHVENQKEFYFSDQVTITLTRAKWAQLRQPLFSYSLHSPGISAAESTWCPSSVVLGDTQHYFFSLNGVMIAPYSTMFRCEMRILPRSYDSDIIVVTEGLLSIDRNFNITIVGFDPADPDEHPLKVMSLRPSWSRDYRFPHMALKMTALVSAWPSTNQFQLTFTMQQETRCNDVQLYATEEFQYITSPNYPQPYFGMVYCHWSISASSPLHFELVEYDGGDDCRGNSLLIHFEPGRLYTSTTQICKESGKQVILEDAENTSPYSCCSARVEFSAPDNDEHHRGFMLRFKTQELPDLGGGGDISSSSSSGNTTGVAVGASIASILFVLMFGAAVAVFVMHRRRVRHQQRLRSRAEFLRNRGRNSGDADGDNRDSNTPSVFIVGSMVVNTNSPPPPYPGLPETPRDGTEDNSTLGYYTNPDGGYTNPGGQFSPDRGNVYHNARGNAPTAAGAQPEYSQLEDPPPYHPLMPGSPLYTDEHFYHPLSSPTRDSGISDVGRSTTTLYSVAQNSSSSSSGDGGHRTTTPAPYSLATPSRQDGQGERVNGGNEREATTRSAEPGHDPANRSTEAGYATPSGQPEERQAPPPYEFLNPLQPPPPAYDVATASAASRENTEVRGEDRGQQGRTGRLGPL